MGRVAEAATLLSAQESAELSALAWAAVVAAVRGEPLPPLPDAPGLRARAGAFVSLYRRGELRGCLGHLEPDHVLVEVTRQMAVSATRDDPRFAAVHVEELEEIEVEVSVLTPPAPARPEEVVAGRDGVLVRCGDRQGVLLPQVARTYAWSAEQLLDAVCRKAGLAPRAWCEPGTELLTFRAQVIADPRSQ